MFWGAAMGAAMGATISPMTIIPLSGGKICSIKGWILAPIHGALAASPALNVTNIINAAMEN
jgi:hypothetical protein